MEFLKNNYEKVILSVVLLGLAVAAALLPTWVASEKRALDETDNLIAQTERKELKSVNLSTNEIVLQRVVKATALHLSGEHNLFNPVPWQRMRDGHLIPIRTGREIGPSALVVTKIDPLHLKIEYEGLAPSADTVQFRFRVTRETEKSAGKRVTPYSASPGGPKNQIFMLREAKPKDNPVEFTLELADTKEQVTVTKDKPYISVAGFTASLKYGPDNLTFPGKRVGDTLVFAGDTNKIVAITETNVTVAAASNTKRTTVAYTPTP
jgi:hypothetical protein